MHSSRMRTARSLIVSPYLVVSHARPPGATTHAPPAATTHAPREQPCMPPRSNHAWPPQGATTHAPLEQPCMPPPPVSNHACPREQPCMPLGATMHTPSGATMHAPPGATTHASATPPPPPATTHAPAVDRITDTCKNITFPQLRLRAVKSLNITTSRYELISVNVIAH